MFLTQTSLKSRLILFTIVISFIVTCLVFYAQNLNSVSSSNNLARSNIIYTVSQSLAKTNSILQVLEKELYEQLLNGDSDYSESIEQTYNLLFTEIQTMLNNPLFNIIAKNSNQNSDVNKIKNTVEKIIVNVKALKVPIKEFNETTVNVDKRYPATIIIKHSLKPLNEKLNRTFNYVINKSGNAAPVVSLFEKAQNLWSKQTQNVTVFFSSRLGLYNADKKNNKYGLANREATIKKLNLVLEKLKFQNEQKNLTEIQSKYLTDIITYLKLYNISFERAKEIYLSDEWRKDIRLLEDIIQPEINYVWENIIQLQIILAEQSNESIQFSQNTSNKISNVIWYSAILIITVLAIISFAFEISLLRPIIILAKALNAEAKGEPVNSVGQYYGTEINKLLSAFSNMREQVQARQTRLQSILDNALEGIIITDESGVIESFNNAAQVLFQYSAQEVIGKDISEIIPWPDSEIHQEKIIHFLETGQSSIMGKNRELHAVKKDGTVFPVSVKVNEMIVDGQCHFTAVVEDVSERKALIDDLHYQANHDSLTSLYNRNFFNNALEKAVNEHVCGDSNTNAIIYLDLDNFKYVNDTMGHLAGDQLIVEVSKLLQARIRKADILGRMGGDEFAILLYHESDVKLSYVADCFREILCNYTFKYEGHVVDITCSIGAAYINNEIKTKEDLLARADFACHEAKRLGRNQVYVYSKDDDKHVSDMSRDIGWTRRIKQALIHDHFLLACQPIYNTKENTVSYYEVLLRMTDVDDKIIMPYGFLAAAERFGLMLEIDSWVLRNALRLLSEQQKCNPTIKISINLSAHSIDNETTFDLIKNEIELYNIDPKNLLFEVTETIAIANMNTANKLLRNIQSLGCKTALDDFGVGYSSFAYLADLPVDVVKIDGLFVKDMATKSLNKTMVRAINDIAHEFGKETVAEYVENAEIYNLINQIGVDYSQGYHLGKPEIIYNYQSDLTELFSEDSSVVNG